MSKAFVNAECLVGTARRVGTLFEMWDDMPGLYLTNYNAIDARLFGLSYPDYLKFCVKNYNGRIEGKKCFPIVKFDNPKDCDRLVAELNRRWNLVIKHRKEMAKNGNINDNIT